MLISVYHNDKRYFIILKGWVYYYKDDHSAAPQGYFSLEGYSNKIFPAEEERCAALQWVFKLYPKSSSNNKRTWYLAPESERSMNEWRESFRIEIDKHNITESSLRASRSLPEKRNSTLHMEATEGRPQSFTITQNTRFCNSVETSRSCSSYGSEVSVLSNETDDGYETLIPREDKPLPALPHMGIPPPNPRDFQPMVDEQNYDVVGTVQPPQPSPLSPRMNMNVHRQIGRMSSQPIDPPPPPPCKPQTTENHEGNYEEPVFFKGNSPRSRLDSYNKPLPPLPNENKPLPPTPEESQENYIDVAGNVDNYDIVQGEYQQLESDDSYENNPISSPVNQTSPVNQYRPPHLHNKPPTPGAKPNMMQQLKQTLEGNKHPPPPPGLKPTSNTFDHKPPTSPINRPKLKTPKPSPKKSHPMPTLQAAYEEPPQVQPAYVDTSVIQAEYLDTSQFEPTQTHNPPMPPPKPASNFAMKPPHGRQGYPLPSNRNRPSLSEDHTVSNIGGDQFKLHSPNKSSTLPNMQGLRSPFSPTLPETFEEKPKPARNNFQEQKKTFTLPANQFNLLGTEGKSLSPPPTASKPLPPPPAASKPLPPPPTASKPLPPPPAASKPSSPPPAASKPLPPTPAASKPLPPPPTASKPLPSTPAAWNSSTASPGAFKPSSVATNNYKPQNIESKPFTRPPVTSKPLNRPPTADRPFNPPPTADRPFNAPPTANRPFNQPPTANRPCNPHPKADRPFNPPPTAEKPGRKPPLATKPPKVGPEKHLKPAFGAGEPGRQDSTNANSSFASRLQMFQGK
uniref:extensin isoform X2 n=1 Tax=Ciona intestinalis TaxID=7719 RepID=UPI000EF4A370|nr:extensin isoform X2 [Ciona intestinalis]|eukprot:XP_026694699.1 extensin isoform X2 [Ciona intestinalis]